MYEFPAGSKPTLHNGLMASFQIPAESFFFFQFSLYGIRHCNLDIQMGYALHNRSIHRTDFRLEIALTVHACPCCLMEEMLCHTILGHMVVLRACKGNNRSIALRCSIKLPKNLSAGPACPFTKEKPTGIFSGHILSRCGRSRSHSESVELLAETGSLEEKKAYAKFGLVISEECLTYEGGWGCEEC